MAGFTITVVVMFAAILTPNNGQAYKLPKSSILPSNYEKYDIVEKTDSSYGGTLGKSVSEEKKKIVSQYDNVGAADGLVKGQEDVLYVKGKPVNVAKEREQFDYVSAENDEQFGGENNPGLELKQLGSGRNRQVYDEGAKEVASFEEGKLNSDAVAAAATVNEYGGKVEAEERLENIESDVVDSNIKPGIGKYDEAGTILKEEKEITKYSGASKHGGGHKKHIIKQEVVKKGSFSGDAEYNGGHKKQIIKEEVVKQSGFGGTGKYNGGHKKQIIKEEVVKEGSLGDVADVKGNSYGNTVVKETNFGQGEEVLQQSGGFVNVDDAARGGDFGSVEESKESVKISAKGGVGLGGVKEENKAVEIGVEGDGYVEEGPKGSFGVAPYEGAKPDLIGPDYGGVEKKVVQTETVIKADGYGNKGTYGGDVIGDVADGAGYGSGKKVFEEKTEEIEGVQYDNKGYGVKPTIKETSKTITTTTLTTKACNQMIDRLLDNLQTNFVGHMSSFKMNTIAPVSLGKWANIRMYDGKFDKIGQICRVNDFQVLPEGDNVILRGVISVPQPKAKFCADAYLYNRFKIRNRNLMLCAKDATFKVQMAINKQLNKISVDDLEPVAIEGFHVEDEFGPKSDALVWPFNKIRAEHLNKQKYQFMSTLQHQLCDDFRKLVHRPEIKQELIRQV